MFCFQYFQSFGFGGSRRGCPSFAQSWPLVRIQLLAGIQPQFLVSAASGVSAQVRASIFCHQVFSFGSAGVSGAVGAALFARRGAAFIRTLAASSSPLFLVWPGQPCPAFVRPSRFPSRCWCGAGSGSWAEAAFAAGLGVPVLVFLPAGSQPPASWGAWQRGPFGGFLLSPAPALPL